MASLKETKKRIVSVKNTQKITRAMKLVSSAKYARSVRYLLASRPYRQEIKAMARRVLNGGENIHPLMAETDEKKILLLLVASDRGLCGSLNTNLFKKTLGFFRQVKAEGKTCTLGVWGKKAVNFAAKLDAKIWQSVDKQASNFSFEMAVILADSLCQEFLQGQFDAVYIAYSHYENALIQKATVNKLLPLARGFLLTSPSNQEQTAEEARGRNELLEPRREELLPALLKKALAAEIYHSFLAGAASEHAARMTAMDNATNNADDVISNLTLEYNQARQAAITKELIEITSGAEAL